VAELVILTEVEARIAALVGCERRHDALIRGLKGSPGIREGVVWTIDIEGAAAELAFAKCLGWYWDGAVGVFHRQADVRHVHVRCQREHHWDLCIRPHDVPGVYALVTGRFPRYQVHGWAKWPGSPSYEASPNPARPPARYIRQADLRPLAELEGHA
jgi:hypothetical protein